MKVTTKILFLFIIVFALFYCNRPAPRKYVAIAVLNTNKIMDIYRPGYFYELQELKKKGRISLYKNDEMQQVSVEEYIRRMDITTLNDDIDKIKALSELDETKPLKEASLNVFQYGMEVFENDYLHIARMMDENKPQAEIELAIQKLFNKHDLEMGKRVNQLDSLAMAYAKKHNVPLEFR